MGSRRVEWHMGWSSVGDPRGPLIWWRSLRCTLYLWGRGEKESIDESQEPARTDEWNAVWQRWWKLGVHKLSPPLEGHESFPWFPRMEIRVGPWRALSLLKTAHSSPVQKRCSPACPGYPGFLPLSLWCLSPGVLGGSGHSIRHTGLVG